MEPYGILLGLRRYLVGIDREDDEAFLRRFVATVADAGGCRTRAQAERASDAGQRVLYPLPGRGGASSDEAQQPPMSGGDRFREFAAHVLRQEDRGHASDTEDPLDSITRSQRFLEPLLRIEGHLRRSL